jgi:WhiB family redox-sensing transcriptional regulator
LSKLNTETLSQIKLDIRVPREITMNAACKKTNPMIMDGETRENIQAAREVCGGCPVSEKCGEWAIWHEPHGVWSGMTPRERKVMRKGQSLINIEDVQVLRQLIANLFSGKTVEALAEEYKVTDRTIYRWREQIKELNIA